MWRPDLESTENLHKIFTDYTEREEYWQGQWTKLSAMCDDNTGNIVAIRLRMKVVMTQETKCSNKAFRAEKELLFREAEILRLHWQNLNQ